MRKLLILGLVLFLLFGCTDSRPANSTVTLFNCTDINCALSKFGVTGLFEGTGIDVNANKGDILVSFEQTYGDTRYANITGDTFTGTVSGTSFVASLDLNSPRICIGTDCRTVWPSVGAGSVTGIFEGGNIDVNAQTGDVRIHFDDGNFLTSRHDWNAVQVFFQDINALKRINALDINAGNRRILHNNIVYDLVDLNRSAVSICAGDVNSVVNSQNQCISMNNMYLSGGAASSGVTGIFEGGNIDINASTGDVRIHFDDGNFLSVFHRWTAPQLFTADINGSRANFQDVNAKTFYVTGIDLNVVYDSRYVNVAGDTMTGALTNEAGITVGTGTNTISIADDRSISYGSGGDSLLTTAGSTLTIRSTAGGTKSLNLTGFNRAFPNTDNAVDLGIAETNRYKNIYLALGVFSKDVNALGDVNGFRFCLSADCRTAWPSGTGGSSQYSAGGNIVLVTADNNAFHFNDGNFLSTLHIWSFAQRFTADINASRINTFDLNVGSGIIKVNNTNYSIQNDLNKYIPYSDLNNNFVRKGTTTQQQIDSNILISNGGGQIKLVPDQNMIIIGGIWCIKTINAGGDLNLSIAGC